MSNVYFVCKCDLRSIYTQNIHTIYMLLWKKGKNFSELAATFGMFSRRRREKAVRGNLNLAFDKQQGQIFFKIFFVHKLC